MNGRLAAFGAASCHIRRRRDNLCAIAIVLGIIDLESI